MGTLPPQGSKRRGLTTQRPRHCAGAAFFQTEKNMDQLHLTDPEPLESFELDEYADQEEISSALKEMLDRELY
jgi:hypothetical protein